MTRAGNKPGVWNSEVRHNIRKQVILNNPKLNEAIRTANKTGVLGTNFWRIVENAFKNINNPKGPEYRRNKRIALPSTHASILNKLKRAYNNLHGITRN